MKIILLILSCLSFCSFIISCNDPTTKSPNEILKTNSIDSLRLNTTGVDLAFYSDFSKSSIQIPSDEISRKSFRDSIFKFIGNRIKDTCKLPTLTPDGTITFYNGNSIIAAFFFVLNNSCSGFYDHFLNSANKYELTSFGNSSLSEIKKKLLIQFFPRK